MPRRFLKCFSEFKDGEFARGRANTKKTVLTPAGLNDAVRELEKSLLVDNPDIARKSPLYDFYSVQIKEFGKQVLEKYR